MKKHFAEICVAVLIFAFSVESALAHGVIGKRFIPSTMTLEDPFPSDELAITGGRGSKNIEERESSVGFEFAKRLTPDLALGVEWEYIFIDPSEPGEPRISGAGNPEFSVKYALFRSAEREGILSVGLGVEAGGVGSKKVAEKVTTITPALFFGKGLGDLPDALNYLKPLAVTGSVGVNIPANRKLAGEEERSPTTVAYGFALMYSVLYLQSFVKDVGLGAPFDRLFPVVAFNFETHANNPERGKTTAFVNPGLLWAGKYIQLGVEAQVPMNNRSGKDVGVKGLIHFFLDDIAPNIFTWTPWGVIGPTRK